jgi:hypothetical protein
MFRILKRATNRALTQVIYKVLMATVGIVAIGYLSNKISTLF